KCKCYRLTKINIYDDIFTSIDDIKNTYQENKILKENLSEYKTLIYEVQELTEENEELRNSIDLTDSIRDFNPIQATVISRSQERWMELVTLNKRSEERRVGIV